MMPKAASAESMAELLRQGILDQKAFYIIGHDGGQPVELVHALVEARCEDIVQGRQPLSHLTKGPTSKPAKKKIAQALKAGKQQPQSKL